MCHQSPFHSWKPQRRFPVDYAVRRLMMTLGTRADSPAISDMMSIRMRHSSPAKAGRDRSRPTEAVIQLHQGKRAKGKDQQKYCAQSFRIITFPSVLVHLLLGLCPSVLRREKYKKKRGRHASHRRADEKYSVRRKQSYISRF